MKCSARVALMLVSLSILGWAEPSSGSCIQDEETLCLKENRFRVGVQWATDARSGSGQATELTPDSGYFTFFHPDNVEITLKVLDGRSFNDRFWVFYGSLSDVEYTVTVEDTWTGWIRRYRNPAGEQTAVRDTSAFREEPIDGDLLVVTAHPDDEVLLSPMLGNVCRDRGRRCLLLVLTEGEKGVCRLPDGCEPDVATVRRRELEAAADLLGLELEVWNLADGAAADPEEVREGWAGESDGDLVPRLAASIAASGAEVVVSFDPRHGSTCHADHRATGALVREAVGELENRPRLLFLETRVIFSPRVKVEVAVPEDDAVESFDANVPAPALGSEASAWDYLLRTARLHRSQIAASTVEALEDTLQDERRVHLLPAGRSSRGDPRYEEECRP